MTWRSLRPAAWIVALTVAATTVSACTHGVGRPQTFAGVFDRFEPPASYVMPAGILAGPNAHMWYVLRDGTTSAIGEIDNNGKTVVHPLPQPVAQIYDATIGPDGAVWFTMMVGGTLERTMDTYPGLQGGSGAVGRMAPDGQVRVFSLPASTQMPGAIVRFAGALWVTGAPTGWDNTATPLIWRLATDGSVTTYDSPGQIGTIFADGDRALWYVAELVGPGSVAESGIGWLDPNGRPHPVTLPAGQQGWASAGVIGPDGDPWFTIGQKLMRLLPDGTFVQIRWMSCGPMTTSGPDLWCGNPVELDQVSETGTVTTHAFRTGSEGVVMGSSMTAGRNGLAAAADGSIWFSDATNSLIWRYR
jgi:streptogramin lyase